MPQNPRLEYLYQLYSRRQHTAEEKQELFELIALPENEQNIKQLITDTWSENIPDYEQSRANEIFNYIVNRPDAIPVRRTIPHWLKYAAAVIIILVTAAYLWNTNKPDNPAPVIAKTTDILPAHNKAILTLSDGKKIQLDSATSETITDGSLSIVNNNGELKYNASGEPPIPSPGGVAPGGANSNLNPSSPGAGVGYNTMSTPAGGQYQITLSDGTKAWLNAASSITFPTVFKSATREVTITGEVYFEVKKDITKPFIVRTPEDQITVLGTSFNVNAYKDEPSAKTSLSEGAIKIANKILKPGQAYINGNIITTNLQKDLAWRNGIFSFNDLTVSEAMRQIARWYDVEIIYEKGIIQERLFGEMDRQLTLQELLSGLNGVAANFRLSGRKLYISPL